MTEQFALDECFGEGAAVHRDERPAAAAAEAMHVARDQFLAGAGLADDQHVRVARREANPVEQRDRARIDEHLRAGTNGCRERGAVGSVRTGAASGHASVGCGSRVEARRRIGSLERPFADLANLVRERIVERVGAQVAPVPVEPQRVRRAGAGDVEHPRAEIEAGARGRHLRGGRGERAPRSAW